VRICVVFLFLLFFPALLCAREPEELVVATFNRDTPTNEVGGNYGAWNYNTSDPSQRCYSDLELDDPFDPEEGYSVRLDYDVLSDKPAFNGFWMKLEGIDLTRYDTLSFWVKGDEEIGFTQRFKLELKNIFGEKTTYIVWGIESDWKEITLAIKDGVKLIDWSSMAELVIVFDDILATKKEGSILIDQFVFRRGLPGLSRR